MHALNPRALRCLIGVSVQTASERAHVSTDTIKKYERGQFVATRTKRQRLDELYGMWRAELAWSAQVARTVTEDDEMSPRDIAGEPPESGLLPVAESRAA